MDNEHESEDELESLVCVLGLIASDSCCMKHGLRKMSVALITLIAVHGLDVNMYIEFMRKINTDVVQTKSEPKPITEKIQ